MGRAGGSERCSCREEGTESFLQEGTRQAACHAGMPRLHAGFGLDAHDAGALGAAWVAVREELGLRLATACSNSASRAWGSRPPALRHARRVLLPAGGRTLVVPGSVDVGHVLLHGLQIDAGHAAACSAVQWGGAAGRRAATGGHTSAAAALIRRQLPPANAPSPPSPWALRSSRASSGKREGAAAAGGEKSARRFCRWQRRQAGRALTLGDLTAQGARRLRCLLVALLRHGAVGGLGLVCVGWAGWRSLGWVWWLV